MDYINAPLGLKAFNIIISLKLITVGINQGVVELVTITYTVISKRVQLLTKYIRVLGNIPLHISPVLTHLLGCSKLKS